MVLNMFGLLKPRKPDVTGAMLIQESELFDAGWYIKYYGLDLGNKEAAVQHYLKYGVEKGLNPSVRFDANLYLARNPDIKRAGVNPLLHYLKFGRNEGRAFEPVTTRPTAAINPADNPDIGITDIRLIENSAYFDADWYIQYYGLKLSGTTSAAKHYLENCPGGPYSPSPAFDSRSYLSKHDDVKLSGVNPLLHYIKYGIREKRAIFPMKMVPDKKYWTSKFINELYAKVCLSLKKGLVYDEIETDIQSMQDAGVPDAVIGDLNIEILKIKKEHARVIELYSGKLKLEPENSGFYFARAVSRIKNGEFNHATATDFKKSVLFSNRLDDKAIRYFSYMWEACPLNENIMDEFRGFLDSLSTENKASRYHGKLLLLYAAMLSEYGRMTEAKTAYDTATSMNLNAKNYLALRCRLNQVKGSKAASGKEMDFFRRLLEHESEFERLVLESNGEVCVVGNAPTETGKGLGEEIDSNRLVIRFNSYSTDYPYCEDYGLKTDVWVRMPFHPYVKNELNDRHKLVIFSGSNRLNRPYPDWDSIMHLAEKVKVSFFNKKYFYELQDKLGAPPTSGLMVCYMLYKIIGPLLPRHYYGLSFSAKGAGSGADNYHYSDANASSGVRHYWNREKEIFDQICFKPGRDKDNSHYLIDRRTRFQGPGEIQHSFDNLPYVRKAGIRKFISLSPALGDYVINGKKIDVVSVREATEHINYLGGNQGVASQLLANITDFSDVCFLGFGRSITGQNAVKCATHFGAKYLLAEYGLISSMHLPSEKKFDFSLILDDRGIFYDTTQGSMIENILCSDPDILAPRSRMRAAGLMAYIRDNHITKYNNSPDIILPARKKSKRILVVDQTAGDYSILLGQCDKYSFQDMLAFALQQPDAEVVLKLHPETAVGAKPGNFDPDQYHDSANLTVISHQCNIISLIKQVDEVYVMSSGVGFDALITGKPVRCFGVPFYAGWGLTTDMTPVMNKRRNLTVEALFAGIYFKYTMFFHPESRTECEMEDCLEWISNHKINYPPISL